MDRQERPAEPAQKTPPELAGIVAMLERINDRLDRLEAVNDRKPEFPDPGSLHPSQKRFEIAEAIADAIIAGKSAEKACTFEPNPRPCDSCSMCSSRGF